MLAGQADGLQDPPRRAEDQRGGRRDGVPDVEEPGQERGWSVGRDLVRVRERPGQYVGELPATVGVEEEGRNGLLVVVALDESEDAVLSRRGLSSSEREVPVEKIGVCDPAVPRPLRAVGLEGDQRVAVLAYDGSSEWEEGLQEDADGVRVSVAGESKNVGDGPDAPLGSLSVDLHRVEVD